MPSRANDFVILGAPPARSPAALCSMARRPVRAPRDLVGATVLAETPSDRLIIEAILSMANLPRQFTMRPTGFSPEPPVDGDGDAYFRFAISQPNHARADRHDAGARVPRHAAA